MSLTSEDRSMPHACRADGLSCASICSSFACVRNGFLGLGGAGIGGQSAMRVGSAAGDSA